MVGKYIKCFERKKDDMRILRIDFLDNYGFTRSAFLREVDVVDYDKMYESMLDLNMGTPIAFDVLTLWNRDTGKTSVRYRGVYFCGVSIGG